MFFNALKIWVRTSYTINGVFVELDILLTFTAHVIVYLVEINKRIRLSLAEVKPVEDKLDRGVR